MKGLSPIEGNPQKHPKVILGSAVIQNISSYNKQGNASHSALQNQQSYISWGVQGFRSANQNRTRTVGTFYKSNPNFQKVLLM